MKIRKLSENVISKISAGEVINSPSDVIKELVENSIDAKSDEIFIQVRGKGLNFIKVKDNGEGILKDDLLNLAKKHYTSKLNSFEEIYNLKTFGFRGEALYSISIVSKLIIRSSVDGVECYEVIFEGGNLVDFRNSYCQKGTTVLVKELFFNVPIRRNFISSSKIEIKKIKKVILNYVLAFENITFKVEISNKRLVFEKFPSREDRIRNLFGDFQKKILKTSDFLIEFYIFEKLPESKIFVNRRPVLDSKISQILSNLNIKNYFVFIDVNPRNVDVNVHPKKLEVKFSKDLNIYDEIKKFLKDNVQVRIKPKIIQISKPIQKVQTKFITTISKNKLLIIHRERALFKIYFQKLLNKQYKTQMLAFPYVFKFRISQESEKILKLYGFSVLLKEKELVIDGIPDIIENISYEDLENIINVFIKRERFLQLEDFINVIIENAIKYSNLSDEEIILKLLSLKKPNFDNLNRRIIYEIDLDEIEKKF
ncbi:MAG: DNA mismatch repair endonuclease MutL [candidate division WOR-3 bacterium]